MAEIFTFIITSSDGSPDVDRMVEVATANEWRRRGMPDYYRSGACAMDSQCRAVARSSLLQSFPFNDDKVK